MAKMRARARTVDMLGRQQIANASTAISELFKNAYDAYADDAEVDYFRSDGLLVIRDNGVGMTRDEFENRWLVLGTESKAVEQGQKVDTYRPHGMSERAVMGEKGIGRLAIALLGRQVLVLTRAERASGAHDLVMCFIHWGLFEINGINLEQIELPIKEIKGGILPSQSDVQGLISEVRQSVLSLESQFGASAFSQIKTELDEFQLDPQHMNEFLGGISLFGDGRGTHFYIAPADSGIADDIEGEKHKGKKDFTKFLLGFSNATFCENTPSPISTSFRYWPSDASSDELIQDAEFFTHEELDSADHRITGRVDEFGQFVGDVRVYDQHNDGHVIPWKNGLGKPTRCGPFEIEFGYIQGAQSESVMSPDDWRRLYNKTEKIGGIYVYRDRIRILPYGNSDVDWLNVEERRTKSAGYYFFSHRRLFGAVKLTREANSLLREKAGREGFQQDKAYRQLTDILENLFIQITADFFRESGDYSDKFIDQKAEYGRLALARKKREKQVSTKKVNFEASLKSFFHKVEGGLLQAELGSLRDAVKKRMDSAAQMNDPDEASLALLDAEKEANRKLTEIRNSYTLSKPRGVSFSRATQRDWDAYRVEQEKLETEQFVPFLEGITNTLGLVAKEAKLYVDQRRRLTDLIKQQVTTEKKAISSEASEVRSSAEETRNSALRVARDAIHEFQNTVATVESDFGTRDLTGLSESDIEKIRKDFESKIDFVGKKNTETLGQVRDMLTAVSSNLNDNDGITQTDILEAMDQELQGLREQTDTDAELVQLGLAVAVINHEFEAAIKGVRRTLRELRPWADTNTDLSSLYQDIRNNFDHLDGHLNLFTPLQRRLYRKPIEIKGSEVRHYVQTLFDVRFKRHQIIFEVTEKFLGTSLKGFPSTVYPVFVNLIDNAIFWLKDNPGEKRVTLDSTKNAFLISNNGPVIRDRDAEAIFEQGFTRKPAGRGLGLFISKKALNKEGMDIVLLSNEANNETAFKIVWAEDTDEN